MSREASAPGKLMLAGEYVVLEGAEAVLVAMDRRARAILAASPTPLSPFLRAVREVVSEHAGSSSAAAQAASRMYVDSSAFASEGTKLGLGSSAAVTVAAVARALAEDGAEPPRDLVHALAHAAHGRAQSARGARGSGADIAACVHGGVIAVRAGSSPETPVVVRELGAPVPEHLVYVWTGSSADTPSLVARVRALAERDRRVYDRAMAALADAAQAVIAALRPSAAPDELVHAVAAGAEAVRALGRDAGVELETGMHIELAALAEAARGAAKPTGAGGGDIAVAAFTCAADVEAFRSACLDRGLGLLALQPTAVGVTVTPG